MTFRRLALAGLALAFGSTASAAEEPMTTAGASAAPPPAAEAAAAPAPATMTAEDREAREIGDWARGVLDGRPSEDPARIAARCPPSDGKPHGQVWAGIGTRGYRTVGGVVTQPIGDCGSITLGVSRTESDFGRRHR